MLSKRIGCRHAGERHVFVVITSPISQDPRKFSRILPQRRRWLLPTVSIDYESNHAAPHASGPGLEQNRGLRTVTGGTMMLPMYILARGVSAAQNAGVFFFLEKLIIRLSSWTSHVLIWCFLCGLHLAKHADYKLLISSRLQ